MGIHLVPIETELDEHIEFKHGTTVNDFHRPEDWGLVQLDFESDFAGTTEDKVYVIHYNGKKWEKVEVPLGTTVYVKDENGYLTENSVTKDRDNNITLLPKFDAGWY